MSKQRAELVGTENKINPNHRKEKGFFYSMDMVTRSPYNRRRARKVVSARFYQTGTVCYCCVWITDKHGNSTAGSGQAGGYGYHKASAALANALGSAGVQLSKRIHGVGDSAMEEAVIATANAAGFPGAFLTTGHA